MTNLPRRKDDVQGIVVRQAGRDWPRAPRRGAPGCIARREADSKPGGQLRSGVPPRRGSAPESLAFVRESSDHLAGRSGAVAGSSALEVRTAVVEGPLAAQMRRAAAARANECVLEILNLPQLAARLAGTSPRRLVRIIWIRRSSARSMAKDSPSSSPCGACPARPSPLHGPCAKFGTPISNLARWATPTASVN
jgi:hypothetical protein